MKTGKIQLIQVSRDGVLLTKTHRKDAPLAEHAATFSKTWKSCYADGRTFTRIKGSGIYGGTHLCEEDGNEYIILQVTP